MGTLIVMTEFYLRNKAIDYSYLCITTCQNGLEKISTSVDVCSWLSLSYQQLWHKLCCQPPHAKTCCQTGLSRTKWNFISSHNVYFNKVMHLFTVLPYLVDGQATSSKIINNIKFLTFCWYCPLLIYREYWKKKRKITSLQSS